MSNNWISVKERLPDMELSNETSFRKEYKSQNVLVQTKRDEIFAAYCVRLTCNNKKYKEEIDWYTHGTGGRKMKIMSKVVAWMELPECYQEKD
ncbi:DUF551 domain-containing protein [Blautia difficilis]|uniref:DUF551 domain-containing protein n=1 Tax=Blautia difficilis TaxID=2763027 RepID=A0ABR7IJT4_9FIRM|nr:DUF551 domain-containing protein [Blautia difficilis]MBC5780237.1 DUF551 domain-containing protein [Blautia difficilis]